MESIEPQITALLAAFRGADRDADEQLFRAVYSELRRLAAFYLRRERDARTMQATALVNEVYLKLSAQRDKQWENRSHFMAVCAQIMRRILVDRARRSKANKRNWGTAADALADDAVYINENPALVLAVDAALKRLADWDERQARIVELRYFGGLSIEETAEALEISDRTVKRDWRMARAWLCQELSPAL